MSNHLANITTAGMFYVSLHWAAEKLLIPRFDPRIVARLSGGERIDLAEKVCSTTNGLFSGLLAIYLVYVRRDFSGDIIYPYPSRPLDLLFAGFAGYSLYDLGTMALKPRASKDGPLMWMHHLVGLLGSALMLHYRQAAFFPTAFMVTELTVVPANLVWYMQRLQRRDSVWYRRLLILRALAYVVCRLGTTVFVAAYALKYPISVGGNPQAKYILAQTNISERLSLLFGSFRQLPRVVAGLTTFNVITLSLLNMKWTATMLANLRRSLRT